MAAVREGWGIWACKSHGCGKVFTQKSSMDSHRLAAHEPRRVWPCAVGGCWKMFSNQLYLHRHKLDEHGRAEWVCEEAGCFFTCEEERLWTAHQRLAHGRGWMCDVPGCDRFFALREGLVRHQLIAHLKDPRAQIGEGDAAGCAKLVSVEAGPAFESSNLSSSVVARSVESGAKADWGERWGAWVGDGETAKHGKLFAPKFSMASHQRGVGAGKTVKHGKLFAPKFSMASHQRGVQVMQRSWFCGERECGKAYASNRGLHRHKHMVHGRRRDWVCDERDCGYASDKSSTPSCPSTLTAQQSAGSKRTRAFAGFVSPFDTSEDPDLNTSKVMKSEQRPAANAGGLSASDGDVVSLVRRRVVEAVDAARGTAREFMVEDVILALTEDGGEGNSKFVPLTIAQIETVFCQLAKAGQLNPSELLISNPEDD